MEKSEPNAMEQWFKALPDGYDLLLVGFVWDVYWKVWGDKMSDASSASLFGFIVAVGTFSVIRVLKFRRPINFPQLFTGGGIALAIYFILIQPTRIHNQELSLELTKQSDTILTIQAPPMIFYPQSNITLRPSGSDLGSLGTIPQCSILEATGEKIRDANETLWIEIYSQYLNKEGWVKAMQLSERYGICPTPSPTQTTTPTPTITSSPTITLTPTRTPTLTPTPTIKEIIWSVVDLYEQYLRNGEQNKAWGLFDTVYQGKIIKRDWIDEVTHATIDIEVDYIESDIKYDFGNVASIGAKYFESPSAQARIEYKATICLVYYVETRQWLIRDILLNPDVYQVCEFGDVH